MCPKVRFQESSAQPNSIFLCLMAVTVVRLKRETANEIQSSLREVMCALNMG